MTAPPVAGSAAEGPRSRRGSTGAKIALGLALTLVGLFLLGGTVPTASSTLERAIAVTGAGALALWLGGLYLGLGGRR